MGPQPHLPLLAIGVVTEEALGQPIVAALVMLDPVGPKGVAQRHQEAVGAVVAGTEEGTGLGDQSFVLGLQIIGEFQAGSVVTGQDEIMRRPFFRAKRYLLQMSAA